VVGTAKAEVSSGWRLAWSTFASATDLAMAVSPCDSPTCADQVDDEPVVGQSTGKCLAQVVVGLNGRGSHPHRAKVGLNYLWLHGIPGAAAAVIPVELMARTHPMGQGPALVVVRAASADCVSGIHDLDLRSKGASGSAERTILAGNKQVHELRHPRQPDLSHCGRRRRHVLYGIAKRR
jgi:hypothetical protein